MPALWLVLGDLQSTLQTSLQVSAICKCSSLRSWVSAPNRSGRKRWEMYRANKATLEWPSPHPDSSEKLNHIWLTQNRTLLFQAVRCSSANENISHLYDVCSLAGHFHTALSQLTCIPTIYSSRADSLCPWSASIEVHTLRRWAVARTQPSISL